MDVKQRLMTHPHPSVRVCALLALDGRAADDPQVSRDRELIPQVPPVRDILAAQYPAGYWMRVGLGVSPRYRATVWQIIFLAQLEVGPIPEVLRAVEALRRDNLDGEGAFHLRRGAKGQSLALTGACLWAVARLGCRTVADWSASWQWVRSRLSSGKLGSLDWVWAARAAAAWQCEDELMHHALRSVIPWPASSGLTFPILLEPDLLTLMAACTEAGIPDRIPPAAVAWLKARQLPSGDWPLDQLPGRLWCVAGEVGRPNPWVTVQALSVLTSIGEPI